MTSDMKVTAQGGVLVGSIAALLFGWWVVAFVVVLMMIDAAVFFWRYRRIL